MPQLHDGTEVASDSEAWRAECEAATVAAMRPARRLAYLQAVEKRRGKTASDRLDAVACRIEGYRIAAMPGVTERRAAIADVERTRGVHARQAVQDAVAVAWQRRTVAA